MGERRCIGHDADTWSAAQCIEQATGEDGLCGRHRETPVAVTEGDLDMVLEAAWADIENARAAKDRAEAENARLRERVAALEGALKSVSECRASWEWYCKADEADAALAGQPTDGGQG